MMTFFIRWLVSVVICFLVFPIIIVIWRGPDADFGYIGGAVLIFFLQFTGHRGLWLIPIGIGTFSALFWHFLNSKKRSTERE